MNDINMELNISNYDEAVKEISKLLTFLPEDANVRKGFVDGIANKMLWL